MNERVRSPSTYAARSPYRSAAARSTPGSVPGRCCGGTDMGTPAGSEVESVETKQVLGRLPYRHGSDLQPGGRGVPRRGPFLAGGAPRRRLRRPARQGRSGPGARGPRRADRVGPPPREARLDLHRLARGVRRPRAAAVPAGDLPRGVRARQRSGPREPPRRGAPRPDADRVRHRRAEAALPAQDRGGRGVLVPGLLRARRRVGPGGGRDQGPARGRPLGRSTGRRCGRRWPTRPTGAS